MSDPPEYAPHEPLDHPGAAILATLATFVVGWSLCIVAVLQSAPPWDQALIALPFPGLLQVLWVGPMLGFAAVRRWRRFVRAMGVTALVLAVVNAVGLVVVYVTLPPGRLF